MRLSGNPNPTPRPAPERRRGGFTLIEILIVVVILGILATVVIPQFSNASVTARENTLKDELRYLRTQVVVYKAQHQDRWPGYPGGDLAAAPTGAAFVAQMTQHSDDKGGIGAASPTYKFGPYLTALPANPLSKSATTVLVVDDASSVPAPDNTTGWIYKPATGEIIANTTGADANGVAYKDY